MVLFKKDDILAIKAMIIFKDYRLLEPVFPDWPPRPDPVGVSCNRFYFPPPYFESLCEATECVYLIQLLIICVFSFTGKN